MMMAKVDAFLDALINYDKENIHSEIIKVTALFFDCISFTPFNLTCRRCILSVSQKAIQPYLNDSEFDPDFVRTKSGAAAGLCAWVCITFNNHDCVTQFHLIHN